MAITVGTDGYVTETELAAYAGEVGFTAIAALTPTEQENLIKRATRILDSGYTFKGVITSEAQLLAWPRAGVEDKEGRTIASDAYPPGLKIASYELCEILRANGDPFAAEAEGKVKSTKAGSVSVTFVDSNVASDKAKLKPVTRALAGLYLRAPGRSLPRNRPLLKA